MRILIGLFLIAHGLVHAAYLAPKPNDPKYPFKFDQSWFFKLGKDKVEPIGNVLVVFTILMLFLSGLAVIGVPGLVDLSQGLIIMGSALSAIVLILYWNIWLIAGLAIDIAFILGVLLLHWFSY